MRKILIIFVLGLISSCSTSQSAVAEATDPDVVSRASFNICKVEGCEYTSVHDHAYRY
jgi:hypothetical protein